MNMGIFLVIALGALTACTKPADVVVNKQQSDVLTEGQIADRGLEAVIRPPVKDCSHLHLGGYYQVVEITSENQVSADVIKIQASAPEAPEQPAPAASDEGDAEAPKLNDIFRWDVMAVENYGTDEEKLTQSTIFELNNTPTKGCFIGELSEDKRQNYMITMKSEFGDMILTKHGGRFEYPTAAEAQAFPRVDIDKIPNPSPDLLLKRLDRPVPEVEEAEENDAE